MLLPLPPGEVGLKGRVRGKAPTFIREIYPLTLTLSPGRGKSEAVSPTEPGRRMTAKVCVVPHVIREPGSASQQAPAQGQRGVVGQP